MIIKDFLMKISIENDDLKEWLGIILEKVERFEKEF